MTVHTNSWRLISVRFCCLFNLKQTSWCQAKILKCLGGGITCSVSNHSLTLSTIDVASILSVLLTKLEILTLRSGICVSINDFNSRIFSRTDLPNFVGVLLVPTCKITLLGGFIKSGFIYSCMSSVVAPGKDLTFTTLSLFEINFSSIAEIIESRIAEIIESRTINVEF